MANYLRDCVKRCAKIILDADNNGRATGRTTGQVIALHDGDIFVVHSAQFVEQVKTSILPKNVKVIYAATLDECIKKTHGLQGAVIIDHHTQAIFL